MSPSDERTQVLTFRVPVAREMRPVIEAGEKPVIWLQAKPIPGTDQHDLILMNLNVPLHLATGQYERLTDEELEDHAADIAAEQARRNGG